VVTLGGLTQEEKEDYTLVLKGTIEGSQAIFPTGTRGYQIDAITRRPLWETLRNAHGTGHGVGFFLNVHEGPQVFNAAAIDVAVEPGMITSIEPGLYRVGKHGIRIENLVLTRRAGSSEFGDFLDFETLTICYIATDLIEKSLLDKKHIAWLNNYNHGYLINYRLILRLRKRIGWQTSVRRFNRSKRITTVAVRCPQQ
jgi:Xaa-Pro aminopeptidase